MGLFLRAGLLKLSSICLWIDVLASMHVRLISIKGTINTHRLLEYIFLDPDKAHHLTYLPHSSIRTTSSSRPRFMSPSPFLLCPNSAATSYLKVGSDLKFYNCLDIHFKPRLDITYPQSRTPGQVTHF